MSSLIWRATVITHRYLGVAGMGGDRGIEQIAHRNVSSMASTRSG
jgi:hypothetical protein